MEDNRNDLPETAQKADAAAKNGETDAEGTKQKELTIEQSFARLREILSKMENENTSLEDSYRLYEEGVRLMKECNQKIDRVEKKVQLLNADGTTTDFG